MGARAGAAASDRLIIPDAAVRYILFQRGEYLRSPVTFVYRHVLSRLPFETPLYNVVVAAESRLGTSRIKMLYDRDMRQEYRSIAPFLPERCAAILDIGCGVAGIDVFLGRHYAAQAPDIYFLDRTRVERNVYYLFRRQAAFYNSLDVARAVLVANGIAPDRVHPVEASDRHDVGVSGTVDLVLSLISWGFHYPVDTYVDAVRAVLSPDGVVILDVRKGTDGIEALRRRFATIVPIFEREKWQRVAALPT